MSAEDNYDSRYLEGIQLFNDCEYFEAHDIWEELWADYHGPSRDFYKGLIQVAVCLYHFGNENIRGAKKLYQSSRKYLGTYRPRHLGLDLDKFISELDACCSEIVDSEDEFPEVTINAELIPEIHLDEH